VAVSRITPKTNDPIYKKSEIAVNFEKYGNRSWKIRPVNPLVPGEYTMLVFNVLGCWVFGVD